MTPSRPAVSLWSNELRVAPGPSLISEVRLKFHHSLAKAVFPSRRVVGEREAPFTAYSSLTDILRDPASVKDWIRWPTEVGDEDVVILDLSSNDTRFMRDAHLLGVADAIADRAPSSSETVIVVMPGHRPLPTSSFHRALDAAATSCDGRILLVCSDGVELIGASDARLVSRVDQAHRKAAKALPSSASTRLDRGLIRLLGHFDLGDDECSSDYWDGSLVEDAVTSATIARLRDWGVTGSEYVLTYPASLAPWMKEAVLTAGEELQVDKQVVLTPDWKPSRAEKAALQGKTVVMCHDVVRTGRSIAWQAEQIERAGLTLFSKIACAVAPASPDRAPTNLQVVPFKTVSPGRRSRGTCPQCALRLPFTPLEPHRASSAQMRSYDFWHLATSKKWRPETYGPEKKRPFLTSIPDFRSIIESYGDWIAYKLERAFYDLGVGREVVVVTPDEPAMDLLFDPLNLRLGERLVHIAIPRPVFESDVNVSEAAEGRATWARQLLHAASAEESVVMIDELNRSGSTAADIYRLLTSTGVRVAGYVPILNNSDSARPAKLGVATYPLYEIPLPLEEQP